MKTIEILSDKARIMYDEIGEKYFLCAYMFNRVYKKYYYTPIVSATKEIVNETIKNEYNERVATKSTHRVGSFYVGIDKMEYKNKEGGTELGYPFVHYFKHECNVELIEL